MVDIFQRASVSGQATVDFGSGADTATVTVSAPSVATTSILRVTVAYDPAGSRDRDELEMDCLVASAGNIVAGTGFDILVWSLQGPAHGQYLVNWIVED
jgi:hypothetical protein